MAKKLFKPSKKLLQVLETDIEYVKKLVFNTTGREPEEFLLSIDRLSKADRLDVLIGLYERAAYGTDTYAFRRSCMRISPQDVVDIRTFLFDKAYLNTKEALYPRVVELIIELCEGDYDEAVFTGSIGCVDADTEYLTPAGWKRISEYADGDMVAQVSDTGEVSFTRAQYIVGPATKLYKVYSKDRFDMVVSGNHRIPYHHGGEVRVSTLADLHDHRVPAVQTTKHQPSKMEYVSLITTTTGHATGQVSIRDSQIRWFLACVLGRKSKLFGYQDDEALCIAMGQGQVTTFKACFDRLGYEYKAIGFSHGTKFIYKRKMIGPTITELDEFGMGGLWKLDLHQATVIADFLASRNTLQSGRGRLHTQDLSDEVIGFLQYALSVAGYATGVSTRVTRTSKKATQRLWWHKELDYIHPSLGLTEGVASTPYKTRDGKQYCFTTPTGLWLSRRGGKILVTGNSAKTTRALYAIAYHLYKLSCYLDPHKAFAMDPSSEIVIIFQSLREKTAKELDYARFKRLIDNSPYFKYEFPYDKYTESYMKFPNRIEVKPISSASTAAIGQNVMFGLIDEVNFMDLVDKSRRSGVGGTYDQAKEIYDTIHRRIESRFIQTGGDVPGILCLSSSRHYPGEFTDKKIEEAKKQKELTGTSRIYVSDLALWDIKPAGTYSGETFKVFIGNNEHYPAILINNNSLDWSTIDPSLIIDVPIEHLNSFRSDIHGSLRDLAGKATLALAPFFTDIDSLRMAFGRVRNAYTRDAINYGQDTVTVYNGDIHLPDEPRACHIDIGLSQDRAGVACGHVAGYKKIERSSGYEILPVIVIDAILAVTPPKKGQIDISYLRGLIYMLEEAGFPVRWVTMDGYQSVDSLQIFKAHGFTAGRVSTDKTMIPYTQTRQALSDERLLLPNHDILSLEWKSLEVDYQKGKVDHTAHSTKDVSDAVASVVHVLSTIREIPARWGIEPDMHRSPSQLTLNQGN